LLLGPEHPDVATSLHNLAEVYKATGAYALAEPLMQRALVIREKVLGPEHPDVATSLHNLAELYKATGAYAQAEPLYKRALAIYEKALGPEHPDVAASLHNLAEVYKATGAYAQAEPLMQRALAIREKVLGPEHPDVATSLHNLAGLCEATGAYAQAELLYKRALAIREKVLGPEHPDVALNLNDLTMLYWAQAHWSEAVGSLRRAAQARESLAQNMLFVMGDESRKRAFVATLAGETEVDVTFSLAARGKVADTESFGLQIVLQRKGRVLDVMADSFGVVRRNLAPQDQRLFEQWRETTAQYATLLFRGSEQLPPEQYRELLGQVKGRAAALEGEISQRRAEFRRQVTPVTVEQVQRAIPKGAVLVEWFRYEPVNPEAIEQQPRWGLPRYIAYVLKPQGVPVAVEMGDAKTIETAISDLLVALHDPYSSLVDELARELHKRLIQPLQPHLGDAGRILLAPDGQLNLLPFGVLIDEQWRYLMQSAELTYLTSGRDLLRVASSIRSRQGTVVIADPDFGPLDQTAVNRSAEMRGRVPQFAPMPGTAAEAEALKRLLKLTDNQVLTQGKASAAALKQLTGPRILHLATGSFFLADQTVDRTSTAPRLLGQDGLSVPQGEHPLLRSGLALASANRLRSGQDDGILTALEVAGLDLVGTELVVLSGSDTGVGQVFNGEGVYGLRRAFMLAGVQTQVVSLWNVDDTATQKLIVDFYQRLNGGAGPSAALRQAQLTMLQDPQCTHPYYWGAFIVVGFQE
jgi:CHAT domain-containing protein/tetratricopeptide (TPR) repeat protein